MKNIEDFLCPELTVNEFLTRVALGNVVFKDDLYQRVHLLNWLHKSVHTQVYESNLHYIPTFHTQTFTRSFHRDENEGGAA